MPCGTPTIAWQHAASRGVTFKEPPEGSKGGYRSLFLPCGRCELCRARRAQEWSIRGQVEFAASPISAFVTLTYAEAPPTLVKSDLSGFIKRLRTAIEPMRLRFLASGEYGDRGHRPHYHACLFGVPHDHPAIMRSWKAGFVQSDPLTAERISYTCGYVAKKLGRQRHGPIELVNAETGEVIEHQEPFLLMSRRPGIGADAKEFAGDFRRDAIFRGRPVPAPRYYREAWKEQATEEQVQRDDEERARWAIEGFRTRQEMKQMLRGAEKRAEYRKSVRTL